MATEDNLRDRAKEIRGAFEPSSVTNEAVGGLLLDIINFFIDYGGNGGGGGKPDARYWSKEELKMLDQYLYVLNDKIKALYADSAGDSELFKGHKWEDHFDQPVRTSDPVEFNSVTSPLFIFNELTTPEFVSGLLGAGTRLKDNHLELDEITVRKRMNVFELLIQRVRAVGGQLLLSPASIKIESVEELEDGYKCSFNTDDRTIPEPFVLNDQAFHQTFTGKGINRYWRLTTGAGDDYFILSKTDCEPGSGIPRPGDEVILLGNRTDKARQSAMMLSAYGNDAPYLDTYDGINDYNLSGKLLTREGNLTGIVDEVFGQLSGSGFYGKNVFLRGRFAFNSGQDVEEVLEEVKITANEARDYITNTLPTLFEEVDARIDGQVESFFENYDPTLTNRPASSWTTDIEKERHLNDTFTNNNTGASWKWVKDGNAYKWIEIADVATVKALAIAGKAQETADGKIRNFITTAEHPTPYPPYDVGDLWNQGDGGDIMCCIASRASGNYVAADWVKSNKYTDDAVAIDARNKANEARSSAEIAKTSAEEANAAISDMSSDDIISPIEKQALKKEWDAIMSEKLFNDAQADKFNVSRTLYDGAYNDLATFIGGNLSNLTTNWNVSGSTLRFTFKTYYDARTTLLNNIAYVAKQQAEKAESDAANAQNAADNAISGLVEANKQITSLDGKYTAQQSDITNLKTTVDAIPGKITQEVSGVIDWTKQYTRDEIGNLQIGMVNLLKGSNVELGAQENILGRYNFDRKPETGKIYTLVVCYTLGENNTEIYPYQDSGATAIISLKTKGEKIIESRTFTYKSTVGSSYMVFTQLPRGTYGSKVHWAVLVEGNKGPNSWIPSQADNDAKAQAIAKAEAELAEVKANAYADGIVTEAEQNAINEAQARLDALKIGSVNLVSRKMLLDMNNTTNGSAIWGQDSDGIYISVAPKDNTTLYSNFKNGTQYVISVNCKGNPSGGSSWRPYLNVEYTDGTMESAWLTKDSVYNRHDYISKQGKTIARVYWNTANGGQTYSNFIYSLALYEGNKVLSEPPVATEDLTGQSNVNLVDGGKEVTVTSSASDQWGNRILVIPKLKPNTVYYLSFKAENLTGSPTAYSAILSNKEITTTYHRLDSVSGGIMITPNNFIEGEAKLFLYAGKGGSTAGNSVKYKDVMLVEGFTPPSSYSPSPGDVAKDIKDVSDAVSNLDATINTTFKDGIISEAEAKAIASNINVLNAEKADIDAYYTKLYANAYLTGTAKTNLASAKTAYNTAHTNLINSINTAIADGKATATEKADVDAKFTAYNNALSAYQTRVGEADKAIQDTIKKVADDAQTSANTAQSAANAAQSAANQAQADANAANSKLTTWASDNYISPQEKTGLKQQKSDIQAEYNDIVTNANRYNISSTSYSAAYNSAIDALNKYTATSPENIAVSSDYNNIAAYYTARQTILNSIAAAAKAQVDGVVDTIDKVTTEFNTKIDQKADSVTVSAMRTDLNSLEQVVNQQGSQLQVNTNSIDAIVTKNGSGTIVSIKPEMVEITGATVIKNKSGNKIEFFGTGTDIFNVNNGAFRVDKDGNGVFKGHIEATSGTFNGTITALNGKIGDFEITSFGSNNDAGRWITASNRTMGLSGSQLYFDKSDRIVYVGSHPNEASGGSPILGYFNIGPTTPTLKSAEKCALYAAAPKHSSYLIRSYALYAETGDVRIVDGCFGGKIKNINLYGTSAEMNCDFIIGIIALIASDNMALYIRPGFLGQIIELLNYTTSRVRILRNDNNGLATMLRADKTTRLYYNGNTWLPIATGNLYET